MNFGHAPTAEASPTLDSADVADRFCAQLYQRVALATPLAGREVLEIGSGRGGGASFLARYHAPARIVGVDFSPHAVALCRKRHAEVANLRFAVADAENLPFADASFDIVINVESSHCYGRFDRFCAEVKRVLRPGGWFLYADFRGVGSMARWHADLAVAGWRQVDFEDITIGVVRAMEADDARKRQLIASFIPPRLQHLFSEFAGLVGSQMYECFRQRAILYHRFAFKKD